MQLIEFAQVNPIISVIVPCYNRANLVAEAIESVFSQTYGYHEIIIVDDNSTDDLEGALRPFRERITYIKKSQNEGVSVARNDGLKVATGEYVSFLDSDDLWLPNKSQVQVQALLARPECAMAVSGCEYIDIDNNKILRPTFPETEIGYADLCVYTAIPGSASNVLIRRSVFRDIGGFDPMLHNAEDRDLWMRIAEKYRICSCMEITAQIRIHGSPRKNREFDLMLENRRAINAKIKNRAIRRRADAWMYFFAYTNYPGSALGSAYYLVRSIAAYPFRMHKRLGRLPQVLEAILPSAVYGVLSRLKHWLLRRK